MRIAVVHDYADRFRRAPAFARLAGHEVVVSTAAGGGADAIVAAARGCDALVLTQQRVAVTADMLRRLPELRFIAQTGRNTAHLDLVACAELGITVSVGRRSSDGPYSTTAELTWALILASRRRLPFEAARLRGGHWQSTVGARLHGRVLGVYAFGHIGAAVARVGRAFGMDVLCWGREGSLARAAGEGFAVAPDRATFFAAADVLTLHLPLNAATRGIITAGDLALMKPEALLVNTSRAPLIALGALAAALRAGRPGFAAVDVYDDEPVLDPAHELLTMDNVLCTPHLGYAETVTLDTLYAVAVDQLLAYAAGAPVDVVTGGPGAC